MRALAFILAALVCLAPSVLRADVAAGHTALQQGRYAEAESAFRAQLAGNRVPAGLGLAEVLLLTGRYEDAAREAAEVAAAATTVDMKGRALCMQGEAERRLGKTTEALRSFLAAVAADPRQARARAYAGVVRQETGQRAEAARTFTALVADFNAGRLDKDRAENLLAVAMAARGLGKWQEANGWFQDAAEKAPTLYQANLEWADLFLDKYNAEEAAKNVTEVLKANAQHPDALVLMARVQLEASYNVKAARELTDRALKQNPRLPEAMTVKAQLSLDDEDFAGAEDWLKKALEINPVHLEALSLMAASRWLQDDTAGYQALKDRTLKQNPAYGDFFWSISELANRHHRYWQVVELNRQALAIDPDNSRALTAMGTNLLRFGLENEAEGLKAMRRAFELDPFNVRTFNTLNLYEDVISKEYEVVKSGVFTYRFHKKERAMLVRYVDPVMQDAWKSYVQKYGFTPKNPILVELFTNRDHYGARTIGLPELGAQGTCFGELITAMSPSSAEANWDLVLRHELAHVFHIQLSKNRVGRWFTEGLSEYETNILHPYWKRENARDIYLSMRRGDMWKISELSAGFTRPDRPNGVMIAYQQSSLVIAYLVETYGFPKIVEALKLYSQGKHDAQIFPQLTGKPLEKLDAEFIEWLKKKYPWYETGFLFDPFAYQDGDRLKAEADAKPGDAEAQARWAAALWVKMPDAAAAQAQTALRLDPTNDLARYILAESLLRSGDAAAARIEYQALLTNGTDGYDIRLALGRMAAGDGKVEEAARHMTAAKKFDPDEADPYQIMMQLYEMKEMREELLKEAEAYLDVEEHNHPAARILIDRFALDRRWSDILRVYPRVIGITPMEPFVHHQYGLALAATGKLKEAIFPLESALLGGVRRPAPLKGLLARCYLVAGDRVKAKALAQEAIKDAPTNPDALEVLKKIP